MIKKDDLMKHEILAQHYSIKYTTEDVIPYIGEMVLIDNELGRNEVIGFISDTNLIEEIMTITTFKKIDISSIIDNVLSFDEEWNWIEEFKNILGEIKNNKPLYDKWLEVFKLKEF